MVKTRLRWKFIAFGLAIVILVSCFQLVLFIWQGGDDKPDFRAISFESDAWKRRESIGNSRTVRSQMIDNLLQRHDFRGWSKEQIVDLLGNPDEGENHAMYPSWNMAYTLGLERGGWASADFEYLVFNLNDQQKVIEFGVRVD